MASAAAAYAANGTLNQGRSWGAAIVTYRVLGVVEPTHSTISPATASITADGISTEVVTVQERDVNNNNLTAGGATVVISRFSGTGTVGATTDNGNGTYTATVTSPTATGSTVDTTAGVVVSSAFNVTVGVANAYRITDAASGAPTAGVSDQLTITLVDAGGNTITGFSGDKTLTFSDLSIAGDGTQPTVTDKNGNLVNQGTSEAITFASGVSSSAGGAALLVAYKAETATLNVSDSGGLSSTSTGGAEVSLTIPNVSPVGGAHFLGATESTPLGVSISTLANLDSDANHDTLTISVVTSPSAHGTVSLGGGTLTYTPTTGYVGTDQFTYTIDDTFGGTATSTANVTVRAAGSALSPRLRRRAPGPWTCAAMAFPYKATSSRDRPTGE
jgi:hypothetical protein